MTSEPVVPIRGSRNIQTECRAMFWEITIQARPDHCTLVILEQWTSIHTYSSLNTRHGFGSGVRPPGGLYQTGGGLNS